MPMERGARIAMSACLLLAACTASSETPGAPGSVMRVTATNATLQLPEAVDLSGEMSSDLGAISLKAGMGTVEFQGQVAPAFYSARSVFPSSVDGGSVYQAIAAQTDRLIWLFVYCAGSSLYAVYYETTDGLVTKEPIPAKGTCKATVGPTTEHVVLPVIDISIVSRVSGYTVSGTGIELDNSGIGTIALDSVRWSLYAFNAVNCTSCAKPGWYELHGIIWNSETQAACLGIVYLLPGIGISVGLADTRCFPDLSDPTNGSLTQYDAGWTHPQ
jgi:hypothetical protein